MGPTITSTETEPVISSTDKIIDEKCLTSKTVEDEDRIPIDKNNTINLGEMIKFIDTSNIKKFLQKRKIY